MASYKDPSFQDRVGRAAEARKKALDQFRAKPPISDAVVAGRQVARQVREAAEAEKRAAKKSREQQAKAEKAAATAKAKESVAREVPSEAERKAVRDARYAARKSRM